MKKVILSVLLAFGLLAGATGAAEAGSWTGFPRGEVFYQSAAGQTSNQCGIVTLTNMSSDPGNISISGMTKARQGATCASYLYLPAGWIEFRAQLQVAIYGVWANYLEPRSLLNTANTTQTGVLSNPLGGGFAWVGLPSNYYRIVTGHNVLLNGAWRSKLWVSPTITL